MLGAGKQTYEGYTVMVQGNRNLKNAARARREKTGESYAEALAQVKAATELLDGSNVNSFVDAAKTWEAVYNKLIGTWSSDVHDDKMQYFIFEANVNGCSIYVQNYNIDASPHALGTSDVLITVRDSDGAWRRSTPIVCPANLKTGRRTDEEFAKMVARFANLVYRSCAENTLDNLPELHDEEDWLLSYSNYAGYRYPERKGVFAGNWGKGSADSWERLLVALDDRWDTSMGNDSVVGIFWNEKTVHNESLELDLSSTLHFTTDLSLTMVDSMFGSFGEWPVSIEIREEDWIGTPARYTAPVGSHGQLFSEFITELVALAKTLTDARLAGKPIPVKTYSAEEWQMLPVNLVARRKRAEWNLSVRKRNLSALKETGATEVIAGLEYGTPEYKHNVLLSSAIEHLEIAELEMEKLLVIEAIAEYSDARTEYFAKHNKN